MRNFIVAFMLVILLSSIMFVILRPIQPAQINQSKKEKSNVEKLLTEPAKNTEEPYSEMSSEEKKEVIDDILQQFEPNNNPELQIKEKHNEIEISQTQNATENKQETTKNDVAPARDNNSFKDIQDELNKKYGNDPNAEVSQEDLQKILIKMLESTQKQ
ncbi:hypothetical protein IKE67_09935 [bacterium]|nr:hypothetical protein [bacterium]